MGVLTSFNDTGLATKVWGAAALGLAAHNLYFIRGEHHLAAPAIFVGSIVLPVLIYGYEYYLAPSQAAINAFSIIGAFNAALFTSMTIYRTIFHPLRSFPGPFGARVSKLWHTYKILDSKNHLFLQGLYEKYGSIVRTGLHLLLCCAINYLISYIGPSELTIYEPEIFNVVAGPGTTCIKSPWYDMLYPLIALNSIRQKDGYAPRRKLWDDAFKSRGMCNPIGAEVNSYSMN
jgi:hypothetical protein